MSLKSSVKSILPAFLKRVLFRRGIIQDFKPPVGTIQWGDLQRLTPLSTEFGYDRGGPVDRYYIELFLRENGEMIKGNVLETGGNIYTHAFGQGKVTKSDVLHVVDGNPLATYVGDLSKENDLPSDHFDCIILTQTLQMIYDCAGALQTCKRILKKGGCLLLTVPGITQIDPGEWNRYWHWSFTSNSINRLLAETFDQGLADVQVFGNVHIATAFLYGMSINEISKDSLNFTDPSYQVIIAAKVIK